MSFAKIATTMTLVCGLLLLICGAYSLSADARETNGNSNSVACSYTINDPSSPINVRSGQGHFQIIKQLPNGVVVRPILNLPAGHTLSDS